MSARFFYIGDGIVAFLVSMYMLDTYASASMVVAIPISIVIGMVFSNLTLSEKLIGHVFRILMSMLWTAVFTFFADAFWYKAKGSHSWIFLFLFVLVAFYIIFDIHKSYSYGDYNPVSKSDVKNVMDEATEAYTRAKQINNSVLQMMGVSAISSDLGVYLIAFEKAEKEYDAIVTNEALRKNKKNRKDKYMQYLAYAREFADLYNWGAGIERQLRAMTEKAEDRFRYRNSIWEENKTYGGEMNFFVGCSDKESIKTRYRSLSKIYHPDNSDGNGEMFAKLTEQYKSLVSE